MEKSKSTKDYWNANLYDQKHSFVSKYGNNLIELLDPKQSEKILDLGCGTGDLTKKLADLGVSVVGIDYSNNMVMEARKKYPQISFEVRDVTALGYNDEFDAVFSNATLHWVKQSKQALKWIYQSLKKGGRFVAEFGGKGNVQSIAGEIIHQLKESGLNVKTEQFPWYYPSIGEYSTLMEEVGFRVVFAQHFDRPTSLDGENGLKNWMEMFGSHLLENLNEEKKDTIITKVEKNLKPILYKEGHWIAYYKRIRVIGVKE